MNKVYFFHNEEGEGVYVASTSFKDAKKIALGSSVTDMMDNPFIELRGRIIKGVTTEYEGELSLVQISELDLLWFGCGNCEKDKNISITKESVKDLKYVCNDCGYVGDIPYY